MSSFCEGTILLQCHRAEGIMYILNVCSGRLTLQQTQVSISFDLKVRPGEHAASTLSTSDGGIERIQDASVVVFSSDTVSGAFMARKSQHNVTCSCWWISRT